MLSFLLLAVSAVICIVPKNHVSKVAQLGSFQQKVLNIRSYGVETCFGGIGILLNENWTDKVISVVRLNHQAMSIRILVGKSIINIFSVYAPQTGLHKTPNWFTPHMKLGDLGAVKVGTEGFQL